MIVAPRRVGPVDERAPGAPAAARAPGRVLVGGGDDARASTSAPSSRSTRMPALVDRDGDPPQPGRDDRRAVLGVRRVLDRDPPRAARRKRPRGEAEALGEPGADRRRRRVGGRAADPVEVRRERRPQLRACRGRRGTRAGRSAPARATRRSDREPDRARELGHVRAGRAGSRTSGARRRVGPRPRRGCAGRRAGDPRRAAGPAHEVSLGNELLVGLHDDPARDAQLRRERSRSTAGRRRPRADRRGSRRRRPAPAGGGAARRLSRSSATSSSRSELVLVLAIEPDLSRGPVRAEDTSTHSRHRPRRSRHGQPAHPRRSHSRSWHSSPTSPSRSARTAATASAERPGRPLVTGRPRAGGVPGPPGVAWDAFAASAPELAAAASPLLRPGHPTRGSSRPSGRRPAADQPGLCRVHRRAVC